MESLALILEPYQDLVGNIAAIVTIGQMFSGSFLCYDIYKQSNTEGVGIVPFTGGLVMALLNLKYGFILRDDNIIRVSFAGTALNIIYLMIYYHYSSEKQKVWGSLGLSGAVAAALLGYAQYEDPNLIEFRFGLIITVLMFYLIGEPLFGIREIVAKQSTEGMPFPIILSGTVVTSSWLLYGIILRNHFMIIQNVVALILCAIQLSLFVIYPSRPKGEDRKPKTKKID
ncbi:sugar transporter SWEET1 isoform X2 [Hyposmocoma kahamanoa]|nr:sugar transporter SWEET1 isoform X2 [Hyposmocoma kahamanoa]XP_026329290.1 sugar transporter SWEET1 isoform X2 [Hyposmocoma kahamanoa]